MKDGVLLDMNLVDLSFTDAGRSLRIELRGSIPPYESKVMALRNAFSIRLAQSPGDEYPYFIPEIRWRHPETNENLNLLHEAHYDFLDHTNTSPIADRQLIVVELEGALCGQIIADSLCWE